MFKTEFATILRTVEMNPNESKQVAVLVGFEGRIELQVDKPLARHWASGDKRRFKVTIEEYEGV